MAIELVRVYSIDEDDDPLVGVVVRVFDTDDNFITQNTTTITGGEAYCEFSLDGDDDPIDYRIRLIKDGVAFDGSLGDDNTTPQIISIYSPANLAPTGANSFIVQGQSFSRPTATDPRLCRCSGYFKDLIGRPLANLSVHIRGACLNLDQVTYTPTIVDGNLVMQGDTIIGRTDINGFFMVDLYRNGHYSILLAGLENDMRTVVVPDESSFNIINLLFPVITSIVFDPDPIAISVDESVDVEVTITATDKTVLDISDDSITYTIADTSIASVQLMDGKLQITGISSGSTQLDIAPNDNSIVVFPTEPQNYLPLQITVT